MTTAAPATSDLTGGQRYTILAAYLAASILWWKTVQFATVTILNALTVGYGIVWAAIAAQLAIAGVVVIIYITVRGRDSGHLYGAALGSLGVSLFSSGLAWAVMAWALR